MFSMKQKQEIAEKVEDILLSFNHPEMPKKDPVFTLDVLGNQIGSFAKILPNWSFNDENKPGINPHNEQVAQEMERKNDTEEKSSS